MHPHEEINSAYLFIPLCPSGAGGEEGKWKVLLLIEVAGHLINKHAPEEQGGSPGREERYVS